MTTIEFPLTFHLYMKYQTISVRIVLSEYQHKLILILAGAELLLLFFAVFCFRIKPLDVTKYFWVGAQQ